MTKTTTAIIDAIKAADRILVCGHIRPDGDCVSSAVAVRLLCAKLGKTADAICGDGERPVTFEFLPEYDKFGKIGHDKYDLFIAVDCAADKRLGDGLKYLSAATNSINIDHHPTNDGYCKINHIDPSACSTCAVLYGLFADSGLIDRDIATALYSGLSTDTGHFMHSNTTVEVFGIAKALCEYGIDIGAVNHAIYCSKSFNKIKLTARALSAIQLHEDGKIALMIISQEDMNACGCTSEDTEGLIDNCSSIKGVEIAISMCEQPGAVFRVSFRAVKANVAAAAEKFGGGGHRLAAGCIINGNRYDVADKVISAGRAALAKQA